MHRNSVNQRLNTVFTCTWKDWPLANSSLSNKRDAMGVKVMGVGRYISSQVAPSVTPYIYFSAHVCGAQYTLGMLQDTYLAIYLYHCHNHRDQHGLLRYVAARACSWLSQKAHASFPSLQVVNLYADDCYQDDHHDLPMFSENLKKKYLFISRCQAWRLEKKV